MRRALLLLCTLPLLAQEVRTLYPPNIIFYAQRESVERDLLGGGASGAIPSPGKGQFILHLWFFRNLRYFGCDAIFQPHGAEGAYLVRFQALSLRGPELAKNFMHTGDPSIWTYGPPAAYPPPQVVGPGETLAIDLTPADNEEKKAIGEGIKLVGYVEMPELTLSRADVEAQLMGLTTPDLQAFYADLLRADQELNAKASETHREIIRQIQSNPPATRPIAPPGVGGAARDLSAEDAELDVVFPAVYINGVRQSKIGGDFRGPLLWLYLRGRGRFVLSLVPRPGFEQAGKVEGRDLVVKSGEDTIALKCDRPVTTEYETYIVYVRRDRDWRPDPTQPADLLMGTLDLGEIRTNQ